MTRWRASILAAILAAAATPTVTLAAVAAPVPHTAALARMGALGDAATVVPAATASWLETMNLYRGQPGLAPVTEEPSWTDGQRKHILYLQHTDPALFTGAYASAHTENPASPWFTPEGAAQAGASNIGGGTTERNAIDVWMRAPFHAIGLLRPRLQRSAFALNSIAMLNVGSGLTFPGPNQTAPVLFPGPGAATYLAGGGGESPDPREGCASDWSSFAGLPIQLSG